MRVPLDGADATAKNAPAWSTKLRKFRGTADPLKQQRNIDGRIAQGFKRDMQGSAITLWADAANGQPMKMTGDALCDSTTTSPSTSRWASRSCR